MNISNGQLMTIIIIAIGVLAFVFLALLAAFIITSMKEKKKNEVDNENDEMIKGNNTNINHSNTVETKTYTTQDVKKFMEFDEIKDYMIIQEKGKRAIMVMQCQGINYDLMSSMEKISVENGFVQFLNSLTRPIQLYVQTRKVNLEESVLNYKKRLRDIENKYNKLKLQYEQAQKNINVSDEKFDMIKMEYIKQKNLFDYTKDIIENTEKMSLNKNILTKNYYIIISYTPENADGLFQKEELLDIAFSELYTNAQSLLRVLSVCGISGKILNSAELADLLYVAYNRDEAEVYGINKAIRAGYDSLYITSQDVVDKKIEELDKIIKQRAAELANSTIEEITINNRRRQEADTKEKNTKRLIQEMAKMMIEENEDYLGEKVAKEAIEKIEDNAKEKINKSKKVKSKKEE